LLELEALRDFAPKEAPIYFLMGKIYKKLKDPEKALFYLTTALDLDIKNGNYIKSVIEKLHLLDKEDDDQFELT
jgi:anaphase-promoting complex subunit 3